MTLSLQSFARDILRASGIDAALAKGRPRHFYTLVGVLSKFARLSAQAKGADARYAHGIHFAHASSLCFEAQEVCCVRVADAGLSAAFTIVSSFLGLTGTVSPLPQVLGDALLQPDAPKALSHCFASMHNRLMQLLVTRYMQTHPAMAQRANYEDVWSQRLLAWTPRVDGLSDRLRWRYIQPLMRATSSAADLCNVLQDALAQRGICADFAVISMTGDFVRLDADQSCALGQSQNTLGHSSVMGSFGWAPQSAFALDIHPIMPDDCRRIIDEPEVQAQLGALIGALCPLQTRCDLYLWVQPRTTSTARLDGSTALGQIAWLGVPQTRVRLPFHQAGGAAAPKTWVFRPRAA